MYKFSIKQPVAFDLYIYIYIITNCEQVLTPVIITRHVLQLKSFKSL